MAPTAAAVQHSGIREIVNLVLGDPTLDVVRLEIGEPGFATPAHIVAAGAQAAGSARYAPSAGHGHLREALAGRLARVHGLAVDAQDVIVTQGAVQACFATLAALVGPGDEVLLPDPAWPNYEMQTTLLGATPVRYPLRARQSFIPDPDEVAGLVTDRTRVLVLNSPGNPTGAVLPAETVQALVELAIDRDLVLLADEVYDELIFEGGAANVLAYDRDHVVGVYSFSKTYAMTGWRVGYAVAPRWLSPTLAKLQEPMLSCIPDPMAAGAMAALEGPQDIVPEMRDAYRSRRDLVVGLLADAGLEVATPRGAFYVMLPLAPGTDSRRAAIDLVRAGVSTAPGTAFGAVAADHLRLSLASVEADLREGLARLLRWYEASGGGRRLLAPSVASPDRE
ncbi:MAG: pyridoxal phosphate-dependent aminotransferase [Nitriliruptoraceae bacterium]